MTYDVKSGPRRWLRGESLKDDQRDISIITRYTSQTTSPALNREAITNMEGLIDNAKKFMASEEGQKMQATFGE